MPQHDMILANQAGAAFRADVNDALAALVANSSGATEPATMYAYMLWADTTSGRLKQRNAANNAWLDRGPLAGIYGTFSELVKFDKGADIASGATVDLGAATGNSVIVTHSTGTTAITSLGGASLPAGTVIETIFSISGGTLTITHHATNLYLGGVTDITLANGDTIRWLKMHDSNAEWKMVGGVRASGVAWIENSVPAGSVMWFAANSPPTGFLKANGAAVSRTTYAALFSAIGTTFGAGDGSTTFNVPDLRGEFIRGWDDARGVDSGRAFASAQSADAKIGSASSIWTYTASSGVSLQTAATAYWATTTANGAETRPRNIALLPCVKF